MSVLDALDMWLNSLMNPNFVRKICLVVDFLEAHKCERQLNVVANGGHPRYEESLLKRYGFRLL